jgi:predicted nucleotidyltransferase
MRKAANISKRGVAERAGKWVGARRPTALDSAIAILRNHRERLSAMGVLHVGIFGSVARGEERPKSDVDVLVDVDRTKIRSIYDYCEVRLAIRDLFGGRADVVERQSLRPRLQQRILSEVVDAF